MLGAHVLKVLCTLAGTLGKALGEEEEPHWEKFLYYKHDETRSELEDRWANALLFYSRTKLRPKTHVELETVLEEVTDVERETRRLRAQAWISGRVERVEDLEKYLKQEEENARAIDQIKERKAKALAEKLSNATEQARKEAEDRLQAIRDAREKSTWDKCVDTVRKIKAFVLDNKISEDKLKEIDQLDRGSATRAGWEELGYVKKFNPKMMKLNEDGETIVETMTARTTTDATEVQLNTEVEEQPTDNIDPSLLLPQGAMKIKDANGYWSWHKKPEGDDLPMFKNNRDHHCRACGGVGFADTLEHAYMAGLADNIPSRGEMNDICREGDFPCHSYQCNFAGLYFQRLTDEEHNGKLRADPKGGKGDTWIRFVNSQVEEIPDHALGR